MCPKHFPTSEPYTTTFDRGSPDVNIDGVAAVVVDPAPNGVATCGDKTTALVGSTTVFINGKPVHRLADTGANFGSYTVTKASTTVLVG